MAYWVVNWVVKTNERRSPLDVVPLKEPDTTTVTLDIELPAETVSLVDRFTGMNQHTKNTCGAMSWGRLAAR
jgi:hypothetical protein